MGIWKKHVDVYEDIKKIDDYIRKSLKANQRVLNDAVNELLNAGGKRLRPAMVLLSGRFGKYNEEKLLPLAAAVEIMHMATLVHDDIIDQAEMRRGRPTARSRWGNETAVFTGDFLFTKSFELVTHSISQRNMHYLSNAIKAICEGEVDQFESRFGNEFSILRYLKRIGRKTAMLFALSCQVGAAESQCKSSTIRLLRKFGYDFGMAFQITDDLLDFCGNVAEVGKPLCSDFLEGVYTLPVIYTMLNSQFKDRMAQYIGKDNLTESDIEEVGRLVKESGGLEKSNKMALRYLERCHESLDKLPDIPAKGAMKELVEELIERRY
ncbi:MAG TPA: polyprenyl synthetase family protein [Clostridiales bacterium]|nr:polyprenyl synthetase family protein [Clostridiales bacterium]